MTNTETFAGIAPPRHPPTQFAYETECKQVLEPVLLQLLDKAEAAGWDRRKAAYALMFLAAKNV